MINVAAGWDLAVDISAEWIFVRLHRDRDDAEHMPRLAERVWSIAEEHHKFRVVMEFDEGILLTSHLVGQLVLLHKRLHQRSGVLRICGLTKTNYQVLEIMRLHTRFPNYLTREDAVMGHVIQE